MTDLATMTDLRRFDQAFANTNQLRTRGTDNLLTAAREVGVGRFIAQSFCGWAYGYSGQPAKTETDRLDPNQPRQMRQTFEAIQYLERIVTGSVQPEGVVLRYGSFYGPGTGMCAPVMMDQLQRRRVPVLGDGGAWWSFIHVDDAVSATIAAIERGKPGSIYNIVDDEPVQVREWLPTLAEIVGAKRPFQVPAWLARLLAGEHLVALMTQARAGSNAKAKQELGWRPAHPSWRLGFEEAARLSLEQHAA